MGPKGAHLSQLSHAYSDWYLSPDLSSHCHKKGAHTDVSQGQSVTEESLRICFPAYTEWEVAMSSFTRVFGPLDLEIIDRVYEAAWARLEAQEPFRDREEDGERREELRKLVFAFAHTRRGRRCFCSYARMSRSTVAGRLMGRSPVLN
jgi:hypothetical protein